jgi:hypothetical protein
VTASLEAGVDYFVVVDGFEGDAGTYDLTVACPSCGQDYPLDCALNASDDWTTAGGQNLREDYDFGGGPDAGWDGAEYVYVFTVDADGDVTLGLDIDDEANVDLDLLVLLPDPDGGCDSGTVLESSLEIGLDETLTFPALAGEVYYVVVDGYGGDEGDYLLTTICN